MAVVYSARDLKHGLKVAIKVLRPDIAEAIGVDRFLIEIRIAANLNHPHIVPVCRGCLAQCRRGAATRS